MIALHKQKFLRPSLLLVVSATMASLFPSVMYVDDYLFFGLKHLGSPLDTITKISETNSPVYSVYLLFWITSFVFSNYPIHFYLYFMSFFIWIMFIYTIFNLASKVLKNSQAIFVVAFIALFLVDRPSNQNIFWSTQAIGSYTQHLLPILILIAWIILRSDKIKESKVFIDFGTCILLFGFTGEVLICTVLYLVYLFVREKSTAIHLPILIAFGFLIIFLNIYSDGARNRGGELIRPENFSEILKRLFTFYYFLIADNFVFVILSILVGFLLGTFIEYEDANSVMVKLTILLISLILALSLVCVSAYQSIYHFIGINYLLQVVSMFLGIKLASRLYQFREIKNEKRVLNSITFLTLPLAIYVLIPLPQNIYWLHQQSRTFLVYADLLLNSGPQLEKIQIYTFTDSSRTGIIGPNIPKWPSYGLISLDFVDAGVEEAITLITSKTNN